LIVPAKLHIVPPGRRRRLRRSLPLRVESLEPRNLLAPVATLVPSETLDNAKPLLPGQEAVGFIGTGPAGAADVDWYHFHLNSASDVILATHDLQESRSLVSVISLYNSADLYNGDPTSSDFFERIGNRLLAQSSGTAAAPDASIEMQLGGASPLGGGDYYVAVSGAGNRLFHPYLVGSGYPGSTGDFGLSLTVHDLGLGQSGPGILRMDPAPGSVLNTSPFIVRIDLSTDWIPSDPSVYQKIQLAYSATGVFGAQPNLWPGTVTYTYSPLAHELQLTPSAPLKAGYYKIVIGTDSNGLPLLANPNQLSLQFQVTGSEGNGVTSAGDDTEKTAYQLGNVTNAGLVQVAGALGTDYVDDNTPFDVNDVDLYHFQVTGPGLYSIIAEVFAGRIGSPLNAAASLFQKGNDGLLHFVAANADSGNPILSSSPFLGPPLYNDPVLHAGLAAGDYYLAVSSGYNVPDPTLGLQQGQGGVFDPNGPVLGTLGDSIGNYVLNFAIQPHLTTPNVVSIQRQDGSKPGASPARFVVQFNEPINIQQLVNQATQTTPPLPPYLVFVQGAGPTRYLPRLESYDSATNQATFVMLDGLPSGVYQLHLSGPHGLGDWADVPLAGNDPASGDFVYTFTVSDPDRSPGQDPLNRHNQNPNTDPQDLGILFTHEIQAGITISRDFSNFPPTSPAQDTMDIYQFQILVREDYVFDLSGSGLPPGAYPVLVNAATLQQYPPLPQGNATAVLYTLDPGTYFIEIGNWSRATAGAVTYALHITMLNNQEKPTALPVGAAPAISLHLASSLLPPPPPALPANPTPANPGGLPSEVLLALGSGLLGGGQPTAQPGDVRAGLPGVDVLDRVVAQAPRLFTPGELLQLAMLFQAPETGTEDPTGVISTPAQGEALSGTLEPDVPWYRAIETLFQLWQVEQEPPPGIQTPSLPEAYYFDFPDPWPVVLGAGQRSNFQAPATPDRLVGLEKELTDSQWRSANPAAAALALGGLLAGFTFGSPPPEPGSPTRTPTCPGKYHPRSC
jgi:hypothetical protein